MSTALKDNAALRFAVVTGCLQIAKESIFTGTNNFVSDTISDSNLNEYFGFTQKDVDKILSECRCRGIWRRDEETGMMGIILERLMFTAPGM